MQIEFFVAYVYFTSHNPLSLEYPPQPKSVCHCYLHLEHFPFRPSDLLKIMAWIQPSRLTEVL